MYFQFLAPIFVVSYVSLSLKKWPLKYQVIGIIGTLIGLSLLLTNASFDDLLVSSKALLRGVAVGLTFASTHGKFDKRMECTTCAVRGMLIGGFALDINCCIWSQICSFCAILSRNKYDF